jgi:hypothetical protein
MPTDIGISLFHLNPEIVGENTKVTHLEPVLYLELEHGDNLPAGASDDQIIDVHADN